MINFARRLKELRTERELSTRKLGEAIGVTNSQIVRWENGTYDIKSEQIIKLAKHFGVTTDYLLGVEN